MISQFIYFCIFRNATIIQYHNIRLYDFCNKRITYLRATFETTEERLAFLIHIPVHPQCNKQLVVREDEQHRSSEKTSPSSEKNDGSSEKNGLGSEENASISDKPQDIFQVIIDAIRKDAKVTAAEIAMRLGVSSRAVQKRIRVMRENGVIRRVGPDKGGSWEIINETLVDH